MATDLYIRKPLNLIFSKQNYSALEKNISTIFLAHLPTEEDGAKWDKEKEYIYSFEASKYLKETNYTRLKDALNGLNSKRIEVIDENGKTCIYASIYPETRLEHGIITIHMRGKYVEDYTRISRGYGGWFLFEYIALERDTHKGIFEMCCTAVNRKINRIEVEINLLKENLNIQNSYKGRNKECFERAILPAVKAINERTSIDVTAAMQRKGRQVFIMLSVDRKSKTVQTPTEPQPAPAELAPVTAPQTPLNEKQQNCYNWLINKGFTKIQASNCALNNATLSLFFSWKFINAIDADLSRGIIDIKTAKALFFSELKKHDLRI